MDVTIGALDLVGRVVNGARTDLGGLLFGESARERIVDALAGPFDRDEVVVIRSLSCRAVIGLHQPFAEDILPRAITAAVARAVRDHPFDDDVVVRFPDTAGYLAAYLHDCRAGHGNRWYYAPLSRFRGPDGTVDWAGLLSSHHPDRWRILARIDRLGDLESLLGALDAGALAELVSGAAEGWASLSATAISMVRATGVELREGSRPAVSTVPDWRDPGSLGGVLGTMVRELIEGSGADHAAVLRAARGYDWFDQEAFAAALGPRIGGVRPADGAGPAAGGPDDAPLRGAASPSGDAPPSGDPALSGDAVPSGDALLSGEPSPLGDPSLSGEPFPPGDASLAADAGARGISSAGEASSLEGVSITDSAASSPSPEPPHSGFGSPAGPASSSRPPADPASPRSEDSQVGSATPACFLSGLSGALPDSAENQPGIMDFTGSADSATLDFRAPSAASESGPIPGSPRDPVASAGRLSGLSSAVSDTRSGGSRGSGAAVVSPRTQQVLADLVAVIDGDGRLYLDPADPAGAANVIRLVTALIRYAPRWSDDEHARSVAAQVLRGWGESPALPGQVVRDGAETSRSPGVASGKIELRFGLRARTARFAPSRTAAGLLLFRTLRDLGLGAALLKPLDGSVEPLLVALLRCWTGASSAPDPLVDFLAGLETDGGSAVDFGQVARRMIGQRLVAPPFRLVELPSGGSVVVGAEGRFVPLPLPGLGVRGGADDGVVRELGVDVLEPEPGDAPGLIAALESAGAEDPRVGLLAVSCVQVWGRWLPGFGNASAGYLLDRLVRRRPAEISIDGSAIRVRMPSWPHDIVLKLAGYLDPVEPPTILGGRGIRFD